MTTPDTIQMRELDPAALQLYQFVYSDMTRKMESIASLRSDKYILKLNNLKDLHDKLQQTLATWIVLGSNLYITQRLEDDTTNTHSSFEKFRMFCGDSGLQTSEIELTYSLLIKVPYVSEPSPYKITISFRNELQQFEKIRASGGEASQIEYIFMSQLASARWEVEYSDLSIARAIEATIANWFKALPLSEPGLIESISKLFGAGIGLFFRVLSSLSLSCAIFGLGIFEKSGVTVSQLAQFIVLLYGVHYISTPLISKLIKFTKLSKVCAAIVISDADAASFERQKRPPKGLYPWLWVNLLAPQIPAIVVFGYNYLKSSF